MTVTERVMSPGSWSLRLRDDTPYRVAERIEPFSMLAVFPSKATIPGPSDAALRTAARWMGVVTSPGPQREIAGYGLAMLLGDNEGRSYHIAASNLPAGLITTTTGAYEWDWLNAILLGTYFSAEDTPFGYSSVKKIGTFQFCTPREALDTMANAYEYEWRIRHQTFGVQWQQWDRFGNTGTNYTYITPRGTGRGLNVYAGGKGIDGNFGSRVDVESFASKVIVLGSTNNATAGAASDYCGGTLTVTRVIESKDTPIGCESAAATAYLGSQDTVRQQITLSSGEYDISGLLETGQGCFVYDPANGIYEPAGQPTMYRGEPIYPVYLRLLGQTWPLRQGMSVGLRIDNGAGGIEWLDLTPYVEFEDGDIQLEIGAAERLMSGSDKLQALAQRNPRIAWTPWQAYAATFAQTGGTLTPGNATIDVRYRRNGSTIEVIGRIAIGSTTTFATGNLAVVLPTGLGVSAFTGTQLGTATFTDASAGSTYGGQAYISSASPGTIFFRESGSPMTDVTQAAPFTWTTSDELQFSITIELEVTL